MAATLLAVAVAEAPTAAEAATLAEARLMVAMVATEFYSSLITTSGFWTYGIAGQRPAVMAARRSAEMAAWAAMAALVATAAAGWKMRSATPIRRVAGLAAMPVLRERAARAATEVEGTAAVAATVATAATVMAAADLVAEGAAELPA